jgi:hypothetical protein
LVAGDFQPLVYAPERPRPCIDRPSH